MSRKVFQSLRLQLFCAVLLSFGVGVIIFAISFLLGNVLLDDTVYGHSFANKMADQQFYKLQKYVKDEAISVNNLQQLNAWCSRGDKVYLTVYLEGTLIYESHLFGEKKNELNSQEYDPNMENPNNEYILTLHEGVKTRAFLYYYAGDAFYFWMTVISGLFGFATFSLCFIMMIGRRVSYITKLKEELEILSSGRLEYPVTIASKDELGELAAGIDQMRRSIIKHQEVEKQMRSANSELITAMSHDLRTPLTSLLAYLEIVERKKYTDEEQMYSLIQKSVSQTMRIKKMADKLFEYFLAYATEWETPNMETIDADELFIQILGDYAYALESKGMNVEIDFSQVSAQININTDLLQRALDNLYSNLLKYADPHESIQISYEQKDENVLVTIINTIQSSCAKSESTSIGLITCRRIIEYHKGIFSAKEMSGKFCITISLPIQK